MEHIENSLTPESLIQPTEQTIGENLGFVEVQEQSSRFRRIGATALAGTVVGLAAASWVFQVGPWNEAFRVDQATRVLEETFDPNAATMTVAKITAAVELTSATLIAFGLNSGSKLTNWFNNRKKGREMLDEVDASIQESEENSKRKGIASKLGSIASDFGLSMSGGAGLVTIKHHRRAEAADARLVKDIAVGAVATVPVTAFSGAVAYVAAKSIVTGGESDWPGSDLFVEYGTSNKFWMGVLAVGYGLKYGIGAIKSHSAKARGKDQDQYSDYNEETDKSSSMFSRPVVSYTEETQ